MTSDSEVIRRLTEAMNRRDLAAFVDCFDPEYESEQQAHLGRRFRGRAQVERNWAAMFAGLPDFRAEVVRSAVAGDTVWVEWHWSGSRSDGTRLDARGQSTSRSSSRSSVFPAWGRAGSCKSCRLGSRPTRS